MSDLSTRVRQVMSVYDASYPPSILNLVDPAIVSLSPTTLSAAGGPGTITVTGTNFEFGSTVEINQAAQATTYVSPTVLTVSYNPSVAGTVMFTVRNLNNEESNSVPFTVAALAADTTVSEPNEPETTEETEETVEEETTEETVEPQPETAPEGDRS
jgi:hypothetical protein